MTQPDKLMRCDTCGKPMPQTPIPAAKGYCNDLCYRNRRDEEVKMRINMDNCQFRTHIGNIVDENHVCGAPSKTRDTI